MNLLKAKIKGSFSEASYHAACEQLREAGDSFHTVIVIIDSSSVFTANRLVRKQRQSGEKENITGDSFTLPTYVVQHSFSPGQWLIIGKDYIVISEAT